MKAIRIQRNSWHRFKSVGDERGLLINFPTKLYDCADPDEERLPYDTDRIPLDWGSRPTDKYERDHSCWRDRISTPSNHPDRTEATHTNEGGTERLIHQ
jgi:dTDP-4-dehydrorhamnose 3,5-epimerase-like enzyme